VFIDVSRHVYQWKIHFTRAWSYARTHAAVTHTHRVVVVAEVVVARARRSEHVRTHARTYDDEDDDVRRLEYLFFFVALAFHHERDLS